MLDPVHLAELHGIHVQLGGELVDDALDGKRRLRAPRATDGVGRRGVGEDTYAVELVDGHLVDRRVHEHAQQRDARGDDLQVGTHVGDEIDLEGDDLAVLGGSDLDVLDLIASVMGGHHVLASGLGPLDRATQVAGDLHGEDFLAVALQLAAESAADVRSDDAQRVLRHSRDEREKHAQDVRDLRGRPDGHLIAHAHGRCDDRARLHVSGDDALIDESALHDDHIITRCLDSGIEGAVALRLERELVADVGAEAAVSSVMHGRRALLDCRLHVDDRGERLVVDLDGVQGVGGGVLVGGQHDRDTVAHVADLVDGQCGEARHLDVVRHRPHAGDRAVEVAEILGGEGGHDVGALEGGGHVEIRDLGVGHGAAQDRHVQRAGQLDVVGPVGLSVEQARVLLAAERPTHGIGVGVSECLGHFLPPINSAAYSTDLMML